MERLFFFALWLTSVPHTFMGFTRCDLRNPKSTLIAGFLFLFFYASLLVLSTRADIALIFMIYFFWQQFHYSRQNYGIYRRKTPNQDKSRWDSTFYVLTSFLCLMGALSDGPLYFFGYAIRNPLHVNPGKTFSVFLSAILLATYLLLRKPIQPWRPILHWVLNFITLVWIDDFMMGWLVLNVFHNLQYFRVMLEHEKKLSAFIVPFALTLLFYEVQLAYPKSEPVWVLFLALNFSHYIWDGWVWKTSR